MQTLATGNREQANALTPTVVSAEDERGIAEHLRAASGNRCLFMVAWAPKAPDETSLTDLLSKLPSEAAVVLTGTNVGLPVWKTMTPGDLRALAAQFANRWIAIEAYPRNAIVGVMQQLGQDDSLFIIRPKQVSAAEIERCLKTGEEHRGQSHAWDE